jgi:protein tyrosine phosphatase
MTYVYDELRKWQLSVQQKDRKRKMDNNASIDAWDPDNNDIQLNREVRESFPIDNLLFRSCHTGNVLVAEIGKVKIYGGGESAGINRNEADVLVSLASNRQTIEMNSSAMELFPSVKPEQAFIYLNWADGTIPDIGDSFWNNLCTDITNIQEEKKILFYCMGGHGRTGTALAIVLSLLKIIPGNECPVAWVRENYCKEAVETIAQKKYIEKITKRKVKAVVGENKKHWSFKY